MSDEILHPRTINLTGQKFGRLTVLSPVDSKTKNRSQKWKCLCDCGNESISSSSSLRSGDTKSCGCLQREKSRSAGDRTRTHGMSASSIYAIWDSMIQRCYNEKRRDYKSYGAKGIDVCERWRDSFENFFSDMGHKPNKKSLDRIDCRKGYSPENCKWSDTREQARNRTDNKLLTFNGKTKCLIDWAEEIGINKITLQARLAKGWSTEDALSKPVDKRYSHDKNKRKNHGVL